LDSFGDDGRESKRREERGVVDEQLESGQGEQEVELAYGEELGWVDWGSRAVVSGNPRHSSALSGPLAHRIANDLVRELDGRTKTSTSTGGEPSTGLNRGRGPTQHRLDLLGSALLDQGIVDDLNEHEFPSTVEDMSDE
jgi:hypothetical protein